MGAQLVKTNEKFSVVMSVYNNDNVEFFELAVSSLLCQTVPPDEIVLVVDGPVGIKIKSSISKVGKSKKVRVVWLKENIGLAESRKIAIENTKHDIFAVMDSDDVSVSDRFEKQLAAVQTYNCDVVGGIVEEFANSVGDLGRRRVVPIGNKNILRFSKWRNPINHVTLMFRKNAYLRVGGYSEIRHSEDWDLIVRMILCDANVVNLNSVLVYARAGKGMMERRRRWSQVFGDCYLMKKFFNLGHINILTLALNVSGRLILRLFPVLLTSLIYDFFMREKRN